MKKKILIVFSIVLIFSLIIFLIWYSKYRYKYNQIVKLANSENQEIYILGTYHSTHLEKSFNYSMQDIVNCIENIKPDVVLIESRENIFLEYGVIDGPIDMILAYSYCVQNNIDVEMIDWWEINDNTKPNTTNETRDDKIYSNIHNKLGMFDNRKILIICGDAHFHEQRKRFLQDNYIKIKINNKKDIFKGKGEFNYPSLMQETIENKINYISTIERDEIINNINDNESKEKWLKSADILVTSLETQLKLVKENKLYYD